MMKNFLVLIFFFGLVIPAFADVWLSDQGYRFTTYTSQYKEWFSKPLNSSVANLISEEIDNFLDKADDKLDQLANEVPIIAILNIKTCILDRNFAELPVKIIELISFSPEQEDLVVKELGLCYAHLKSRLSNLASYQEEFDNKFSKFSLPDCWLVFNQYSKAPIGGTCVSLDPHNLNIYLSYRFGNKEAENVLKAWLFRVYPWANALYDKGFESPKAVPSFTDELGIILLPILAELRFKASLSVIVKEIAPECIGGKIYPNSIFTCGRLLVPEIPEEGNKLHVSGTREYASIIFQLVKPVLDRFRISYKVCTSEDTLDILMKDCCQEGKLVTIYPRNNEEAIKIAHHLDQIFLSAIKIGYLSHKSFISISTDKQVGLSGAIFTRHGRFINNIETMEMPTQRDPSAHQMELPWDKWSHVTPLTQLENNEHEKVSKNIEIKFNTIYYLSVPQSSLLTKNNGSVHSQNVNIDYVGREGLENYLQEFRKQQTEIIQRAFDYYLDEYNKISKAVFGVPDANYYPFRNKVISLVNTTPQLFWQEMENDHCKLEFDAIKFRKVEESEFALKASALYNATVCLLFSEKAGVVKIKKLLRNSHFLKLTNEKGKILSYVPFEKEKNNVVVRLEKNVIKKYGQKIREYFIFYYPNISITIEEMEYSLLGEAVQMAKERGNIEIMPED